MDIAKPDRTILAPDPLRVLIVEDSPHDVELMANVLERGGFRVQFDVADSADTFRECLEKAEYDVILAEFNLRNWTAFDALEIMRRSEKDIPLVVVTGGLGDEAAAECLKQGAADYVLKDRPSRLPSAVQRVLEEKRLRAENQRAFGAISRLATIVESSDDAIIGKTLEGVITSWNKGAEELYGYAAAEVVGRPVSILIPFDRSEELAAILARLRRGERVEHFESVRVRKDGSFVDVSLSMFPLIGLGGEVIGAASITRDITDRKQAEIELHRVNRALRTVTECNQAIARATDESHLLEDICGILVREGGYRMAWVGYAEHDEGKSVRPVAHAGFEGGYLQTLSLTWSDAERGPTGTAIRTGRLSVARNAQSDPSLALWQEEALKRGYVSLIALPILLDGQVPGALTIYAEEPDAFGSEEMQLLTELSHDLAFGIQALRARAERKQAEDALRRANDYNRSLLEASLDPLVTIAPDGKIADVNSATENVTGRTRDELIGTDFSDYFTDPEKARAGYQKAFREGLVRDYELEIRHRDGCAIPVLYNAAVYRDEAGTVLGVFAAARDITELKAAEQTLRGSEERFRSLVENATVGIYRTTPQGRVLMANPTLVRMLGFKDFEKLAARNLEKEGFEPNHARRLFRKRMEQDGEIRGMEAAWTRQDGTVIFVSESARAIRGEDGKILYYDGIVEDITEKKRAEEALRLTQFSVEHASDAIFWMDPQGRILYVNEAACHSLGRSREELLSLSIPDIDPLVTKEAWGTTWETVKARGSLVLETQHQTKQGRVFPVEMTANYLDFGGKEYSFAFARDITERKRAEAEHVRLVTAIEQSAEAVMITTTSGEIEYVNPAFSRITGYSRKEARGQNPRILKSGNQDPALYQQLWATILQGKIWHGELTNRRKDGSLYNEQMTIAPVRGERGEVTHFIATKQDITARKELEQRFVQAQKMEAVGRLAGGVAHDFNNLLTVINGYVQILTQRSSPKDPRRGLFEEIQMAGERAASLTRQLLAFSRRQVLEPKVLDLSNVLANTETMLRRLIGEDIELATKLKPGLGRVKVDPGQIEQVIMNLAVNARDAMPQGGKFIIETASVEVDEDYARSHKPMTPGKYVMLSVGDTGCGMDLATQAHIFEPFFTTKVKGKGTGLGLATVYGIVKQSGGFIWVYSEPGQGATFKIYFPCVEELAPTAEPAKVRRPTKPAKGKETILVVEDEIGVRSLVCETLKSKGYNTLAAEGAAEALKIAEQHTKPIHLLLTDVVMPLTGGKELATRLFTLHPESKVLYMSGYTDDAVVPQGISEGGTPLLQKPFLPNALLLKVREVLRMKRGT